MVNKGKKKAKLQIVAVASNVVSGVRGQTRLMAHMNKSRFGTHEPSIYLDLLKSGTSWREVHAALLRLAADIEDLTAASEHWRVQIDQPTDDCGRIYLELAKDENGEAERGLAMLSNLVKYGKRDWPEAASFEVQAAGLPVLDTIDLGAEVIAVEPVNAAYFRDGRRQRCIVRRDGQLFISFYD